MKSILNQMSNQLGAKLNQGFNKTKDFTEQVKLDGAIKSLEKTIQTKYTELGQKEYEYARGMRTEVPETAAIMNEIDGLRQQIEQNLQAKEDIKNRPTCPRCGEPLQADMQYCPICGTPYQTQTDAAVPVAEVSAREVSAAHREALQAASAEVPAAEGTAAETPAEDYAASVAEETPATAPTTPVDAATSTDADAAAEAMFCKECGALLDPGAIFCSECGAEQ